MDDVIFISLYILAFLLILGIPIGAAVLIYKFISRRKYDRRFRLLALIPILTLGYLVYTAIYPTAQFYRIDFKEVTGLEFPESGQILYKTASYPDNFGDYTSVSLVKVGKEFYNDLPKQLATKGLIENQKRLGSEELDEVLRHLGENKIEREFSLTVGGGVYYYVGFLSDKETLIINRLSW